MEEQIQQTRLDKFKAFWSKAHLQYLVLAFLLYGFKAGLYFIIAGIPNPRVGFFFMGDEAIPFIKYFYVFYLGYYFVPEIFLWVLSFYDKRKVFDLIVGGAMVNIICCTCFLFYQIKMQRPAVNLDMGWNEIHDFSSFFDRLIVFQYNADSTATNCYPSLHATFGTLLFLLGMPLSINEVKKEHHFPIWCRIFCIIFGLGIVASTFFIKQHYYVDALIGMILMIAMYYVAKVLIDIWLENRALSKDMKKEKAVGYLYMSGLTFNAISFALCVTMFLFGIFLANGMVTDAVPGAAVTPEILSLGVKYMIGFGIAAIVSGAVFALNLYLRLAKKDLSPKLMICLGCLSGNLLYLSSAIVKMNGNKDAIQA